MSKNEYTGRSYEELRKVKMADMTGEEMEHFNSYKEPSQPGIINNLFYGMRAGIRSISESAEEMGDKLREAVERERRLAKENKEMADKIKELTEEIKKSIKSQK